MITQMIEIGEAEISTIKVKDSYMAQKYKELNDAYTEMRKYDTDYKPS